MKWKAISSFLLSLCHLLFLSSGTSGHPQCLDFTAPIAPVPPLTFCQEYKDVSCCNGADDAVVQAEYNSILAAYSRQLRRFPAACTNYVKTMLCQKCSPYAAHSYSKEENPLIEPTFPGLCTDYCKIFHSECRKVVRMITTDSELISLAKKRRDRDAFCAVATTADSQYCYPTWKSDQSLLDQLLSITPSTSTATTEQTPVTTTTSDATTPATTESPVTKLNCTCFEEWATLTSPLNFVPLRDGSENIIVGSQEGRLFLYSKDGVLISTYLDIRSVVTNSGERGLLGIALHPDYSVNGKVYIFYSASVSGNHHSRVSEFIANPPTAASINPSTEREILLLHQPYTNHNGGEIFFGDDGYLYIAFGDGGSGGDPLDSGQDKTTLLGALLRLDVDTSTAPNNYAIPPDNPFVGESGSREEIFAYGLRNPYRCSVDWGDELGNGKGRIFCADVGQNNYEEVDLVVKGGNYGWRGKEGDACYRTSQCTGIVNEQVPIFVYSHSFGTSVMGGYVYRGTQQPNWRGKYIFGDYSSRRLWGLQEDAGSARGWSSEEIPTCSPSQCPPGSSTAREGSLLGFGLRDDGEIFLLARGSSGKVYRMVQGEAN